MKHFISVKDVENINELILNALQYKTNPLRHSNLGLGKKIGLIFFNPSLRTRLSTQIAAKNLGMDCIVFNVDKDSWSIEFSEDVIMDGSSVEHIKEAAPILGKYFDILAIRTFPSLKDQNEDYAELVINQFKKFSNVPVISLESATLHPLQSLADLVTITEQIISNPSIKKPKIVLTWAPHIKAIPQCVANSFIEWILAWGQAEFILTHPKGYELEPDLTKNLTIIYNQEFAIKNADFIYVKNWSCFSPYGDFTQPKENWMLHLTKLSSNTKIMHCLPVRRNLELAADILDSTRSLHLQQAENRIFAAQAVLAKVLTSF